MHNDLDSSQSWQELWAKIRGAKSCVTIKTCGGCGKGWDLSRQVNIHMECCNSFFSLFTTKHTFGPTLKQTHYWFTVESEIETWYGPAPKYTVPHRFSIRCCDKLKPKGSNSKLGHWLISVILSVGIKISLKWLKQMASKLISTPTTLQTALAFFELRNFCEKTHGWKEWRKALRFPGNVQNDKKTAGW